MLPSVRAAARRRVSRIWRARGRTTSRAAAAGAIRMGRTLGAALTARREVGAAEAYNLFWSSLIFLSLGLWRCNTPRRSPTRLRVLAVWFALVGLFRAWPGALAARTDVPGETERRRDMIGVSHACR